MGSGVGKLINRKRKGTTRKDKKEGASDNQVNGDSSGGGNFLNTVASLAEGAGIDTNVIANEVGKNISDKSDEIAGQVASTLGKQLSLTEEKKEVVKQGISSGIKTVSQQLQGPNEKAEDAKPDKKSVKEPAPAPPVASGDEPEKDKSVKDETSKEESTVKESTKSSGSILSHVARNLTDRSEEITTKVSSTISESLNLSADKASMVKSGVETVVHKVEEHLTSMEEKTTEKLCETKLPEEVSKGQEAVSESIEKTLNSTFVISSSDKSAEDESKTEENVQPATQPTPSGNKKKKAKKAPAPSTEPPKSPDQDTETKIEASEATETEAAAPFESKIPTSILGMDTSSLMSQVGKTLTSKSSEISEKIVTSAASVAPTLLTPDKKDTVQKGLDTAIKQVGNKLSGEDNKPADRPKTNSSKKKKRKGSKDTQVSASQNEADTSPENYGDKLDALVSEVGSKVVEPASTDDLPPPPPSDEIENVLKNINDSPAGDILSSVTSTDDKQDFTSSLKNKISESIEANQTANGDSNGLNQPANGDTVVSDVSH
ncbi:uncharacterized protein LOC141849354 [Brevipalpus obovatus]|uniref:uncharacterized protein LOC141849354 n=1 Tax=Brevipalpus obovatus TaxID=246614 RepID=UPI003D9F9674